MNPLTRWMPVAPVPTVVTGLFVLEMPAPQSNCFYRLRSGPTGVPVPQTSTQAWAVASELLQSIPVASWSNAFLSPVAYPLYDPAVSGGAQAAYLEFKVLSASPSISNTVAYGGLGYILISLTEQDEPIPEFATEGDTQVEQLGRRALFSPVKAVRYSDAFLVAEDRRGAMVTSLGSAPYHLPEAMLTYALGQTEALVVSNQVVLEPETHPYSESEYRNYYDFKSDYTDGSVLRQLRALRAATAKFKWDVYNGKTPALIHVPFQQEILVLTNSTVAAFDVEEPELVVAHTNASGGLSLFGAEQGGTVLRLLLADGTPSVYGLLVGTNVQHQPKEGFWGPWQFVWASQHRPIHHYEQINNTPGCCARGPSGCGATAWAMFYAHHDGWPCNLIGNCTVPTPEYK